MRPYSLSWPGLSTWFLGLEDEYEPHAACLQASRFLSPPRPPLSALQQCLTCTVADELQRQVRWLSCRITGTRGNGLAPPVLHACGPPAALRQISNTDTPASTTCCHIFARCPNPPSTPDPRNARVLTGSPCR